MCKLSRIIVLLRIASVPFSMCVIVDGRSLLLVVDVRNMVRVKTLLLGRTSNVEVWEVL